MNTVAEAVGYKWEPQWLVEANAAGVRPAGADMAGLAEYGRCVLASHLPQDRELPLRVANLACGNGELIGLILRIYPHAQAVLIDAPSVVSPGAAGRLKGLEDRIEYVSWHPDQGALTESVDGTFDVVVSTAAIHHLTSDKKGFVYANVWEVLKRHGIFADYDLFRRPDAVFQDGEDHDAMCATLEETAAALVGTGFTDLKIDARLPRGAHKGELAVVVAVKSD